MLVNCKYFIPLLYIVWIESLKHIEQKLKPGKTYESHYCFGFAKFSGWQAV